MFVWPLGPLVWAAVWAEAVCVGGGGGVQHIVEAFRILVEIHGPQKPVWVLDGETPAACEGVKKFSLHLVEAPEVTSMTSCATRYAETYPGGQRRIFCLGLSRRSVTPEPFCYCSFFGCTVGDPDLPMYFLLGHVTSTWSRS